MAIEFQKEKNKQKYLIIFSVAILIITGIILWRGYFSGINIKEVAPETSVKSEFSVDALPKIDFNILKASNIENLSSYPIIESIENEKVGRGNPFLPYGD